MENRIDDHAVGFGLVKNLVRETPDGGVPELVEGDREKVRVTRRLPPDATGRRERRPYTAAF